MCHHSHNMLKKQYTPLANEQTNVQTYHFAKHFIGSLSKNLQLHITMDNDRFLC